MNISFSLTKYYEKERFCSHGENKPKQTQQFSNLFLPFTFLCSIYNLAMQNWTIQKLLIWITEYFTEKGIDPPRLSAELLLSHVLQMKRIELYTQFNKVVTQEQLERLHELVKRAGESEPIAYLVGKTEFYSLEIDVTPDCMIPRPETELLVECAIEFLRTRPVGNLMAGSMMQKEEISSGARTGTQFVCDLCTGSGCIAVAIAKNFPNARIIATDISDAALKVAAVNVKRYQLETRVTLLCGDLFGPLLSQLDTEKFDLIVCNPPYVSDSEFEVLGKNVKNFEPKLALFAGTDGLDVHRKVIENAGSFLKSGGALMLEIGYSQGPAVRGLLEKTGALGDIKIEKDFNNNDRIALARKMPS